MLKFKYMKAFSKQVVVLSKISKISSLFFKLIFGFHVK